jgi:hypothetical protein
MQQNMPGMDASNNTMTYQNANDGQQQQQQLGMVMNPQQQQ